MEEEKEKLDEAILKVALGFRVEEVTEEFAQVDGELKLTKRKRTKKDVPPDLKAVQLLLTGREERDTERMSDEELQREKERLLALLSAAQKTEKKQKSTGQVCVEEQKEAKPIKKTRPKPRKKVVRKKKTEV